VEFELISAIIMPMQLVQLDSGLNVIQIESGLNDPQSEKHDDPWIESMKLTCFETCLKDESMHQFLFEELVSLSNPERRSQKER
jgi:hypothetical protein